MLVLSNIAEGTQIEVGTANSICIISKCTWLYTHVVPWYTIIFIIFILVRKSLMLISLMFITLFIA